MGRMHLPAQSLSASTSPLPRPAVVIMTVLIPFGCGFYLSYLVRTVNTVISPYLVSELGLTKGELGFLTGIYFITFAAMQMPLGVVLDRYGPRRVQVALLLVAAAGSALFAVGDSFFLLCVARGAIGAGVSGCLMASFKANAVWWPKDRLPLMNNIVGAFGSFGALSATVPVQWFLEFSDWHALFGVVAALLAALAAVMWLIVPERPGTTDKSVTMAAQFLAFGDIVRSFYFWRIAFLMMACHGAYLSYQTLWAGPWLRDVAGMDEAATGERLALIQIAMFVGVLFFGMAADRLRHTRISAHSIVAVAMVAYIGVQFFLAFGVTEAAGLLWVIFGFFGPATFLCFALFPLGFPENQIGRVTTSGNLLVFVFAFAAQWGIGVIIDLFSRDQVVTGHMTAFLVIIGIQIAGYILFVWPQRQGETARRGGIA